MSSKKVINQISFVTILLLCGGIFAFAQNAELVKFEKSIENGKFTEIERDVLNYAIKNPKEAKAFELLGKIRFGQDRLNEAKSLFNRALVLDPNLITSKIKLAETSIKLGETENAKNILNSISETEIIDDEIRINLAEIFLLVGDCPKTIAFIEKLSAKIKNTTAIPLQANCFIQTGEKEKVNGLTPFAKKLNKSQIQITIKFVEVLLSASMYKEASDVLKTAIIHSPSNEETLTLLAKTAIYLKNFTIAKKEIERIEKLNPQLPELLLIKGLFESEQESPAKALEFFEKYLSINPNSIEALRQFVISAIRVNKANKAVSSAEKLLKIKPNEAEFLYLNGAVALQAGNLAKAETYLIAFLEMLPNDSQGCLVLGLTYAAQSEKLEIAYKQMLKCVEINPNNYEAKYQIGLLHKTQGEIVKAIGYIEEVVQQKNDYANALRDLGSLYLQNSEEQKARPILEKAVTLNPKDADTHFQLSRLYNLIKETELAKKHLKIFRELREEKTEGM